MHPDAYMPFYGDDYFRAVAGHPDIVVASYLRAIWHYWTHTHCEGLEDNSEFLRKVCGVDKDDWSEVEAVIFGDPKMFALGSDGKWHQKRASDEWQKAVKKYDAVMNRARNGGKARWKGKR